VRPAIVVPVLALLFALLLAVVAFGSNAALLLLLAVAAIDVAALGTLFDGDRVGSSSSCLFLFWLRVALVFGGGDRGSTMMIIIDGDVKELFVDKEATCFWIFCTRWLQVTCFPYQMASLAGSTLEIDPYVKFN